MQMLEECDLYLVSFKLNNNHTAWYNRPASSRLPLVHYEEVRQV